MQFGAEQAVVRLESLQPWQEAAIAAIALGTVPQAIGIIAGRARVPAAEAAALLSALEPALERPAPVRATIGVEGRGPLAERIASLADRLGLLRPCAAEPDRVLLVGAHLLSPNHQLRRAGGGRQVLPVLTGDRMITIGPLAEGDGDPCLRCLDRHRGDRDPAWPALAAQLLDRPAAAEQDPLLVAEAAAAAVRLAALGAVRPGQRLLLHADGRREQESLARHAECGCQLLAGLDRAPLPEPEPEPGGLTPARPRARARRGTGSAGARSGRAPGRSNAARVDGEHG